MYFSSFFVIVGIFISVVRQSSSETILLTTDKSRSKKLRFKDIFAESRAFSASANKLCVGNNGYMTIVNETNIFSILKNEDYHDNILVDSGNDSYMTIGEDNPHGTIPINFTTIGSN